MSPLRRRQFRAVVRKEVRQTLRDRRMVALLLIAPSLQLFVFTTAVDLEVDQVATAVVDADGTQASGRALRGLLADGTLRGASRHAAMADAMEELVRGDVHAIVHLPPGYARQEGRGEPVDVQVVVDGSDPNRSTAVSNAARGYFTQGRVSPVRLRALYNPGLDTAPYMVPGLAGVLLLFVTTIIAAMGLARENETGTLEQVLVTPIPGWVLLLGKLTPFAVVGAIDFALALAVGALLFGVPLRADPWLLALGLALYLVATLSLGMLISTRSRTQQQAFIGGFLVMLPMILMGGVLTPTRGMPAALETATWANPLRHFADIARGALFRNAGVRELGPSIIALASIAFVLVVAAVFSFRKTKA